MIFLCSNLYISYMSLSIEYNSKAINNKIKGLKGLLAPGPKYEENFYSFFIC